MNKRKGTTVRLTDQAHILLTEKVEDYTSRGHKISMKDIASEAIFMLARGEDRVTVQTASIERINGVSITLQTRLPKHVSERILLDIGRASMCWENPEKAGVFDEKKALDIAFELCHFIADLIDSKQEIQEDSLIEFEKDASVLPKRISKTGNPDEPLTEIIICTAISGGADYVNKMPRTLILHRKLANEKEYSAVYISQEGIKR